MVIGLSNLGSEDEDEEVSSLHLSERPPYHPRHHANSTNSNSNPITPARSHSPGPGAALSSSLQTSNSPPALQEMSDQNLMMAVALYQGELNRRLLQGNDVGGGALPQAPRDQIIQEFSELFRGMIGNGQPGQPYLSSETLQAMIHLHNEANESNDDTGTNEIFWQEHDEVYVLRHMHIDVESFYRTVCNTLLWLLVVVFVVRVQGPHQTLSQQ